MQKLLFLHCPYPKPCAEDVGGHTKKRLLDALFLTHQNLASFENLSDAKQRRMPLFGMLLL